MLKKKVIHKNILVIGEEGVRKSALVNSFLNISKAKEDIGEGVTDGFYSYISEPDNSFRLMIQKVLKKNLQMIKLMKLII